MPGPDEGLAALERVRAAAQAARRAVDVKAGMMIALDLEMLDWQAGAYLELARANPPNDDQERVGAAIRLNERMDKCVALAQASRAVPRGAS